MHFCGLGPTIFSGFFLKKWVEPHPWHPKDTGQGKPDCRAEDNVILRETLLSFQSFLERICRTRTGTVCLEDRHANQLHQYPILVISEGFEPTFSD